MKEKLLFIVPNLLGYSGDAVNERQLAKALAKKTSLKIYTLLPILKIPFLRKNLSECKKELNVKSLFIPIIGFPYVLGIFITLIIAFLCSILVKFEKPRLIYVRSSPLALPFIMLRNWHKSKVIVKIPSIMEDEVRSFYLDRRILRFMIEITDRYVIAKADRIAIPTLEFYKSLVRRRRIKNLNPPILVPSGIDVSKINRVKKTCSKHGNTSFIIGFVGLLEWWQGADILVKAVYMLNKTVEYDIRLLIIGDGPVRRRIEQLCKELNIKCTITGFVPHEEALKIMSSLNLLVVPSIRISTTENNIPIKVIEAWALGIPVVTTQHEIYNMMGLRDGTDILFCEPNPESVARTIKVVLRNPAVLDRLSKNGYRLAKKFIYDDLAQRIIDTILD
ncbi:MAG: glycosyltransferase family 4 protein [Thermoproteota archaeon]|nr:glycosyltransferase family 4 protein [Candidatus Brockarchaeota archaeon]